MKRKAEHVELESSASAEVSRLFSVCKTWRDRCGEPFRLVHRIECFTDKAVVTLASFDRILCSSIVSACAAGSKSAAHKASDASTHAEDRCVAFTITRTAGKHAQEKANGSHLNDDIAFERYASAAVAFEPAGCVLRADEDACQAAARTLNGVLSRIGAVKVKCFPSNYEICATAKTCSLRACKVLSKWPDSYIDLENSLVCVIVDRKTPDL